MTRTLKTHKPVGPDFLDTSKAKSVQHQFSQSVDRVWASLLDADAWTHWLPITKVTWTSPQPFGVGTTRTVEVGKDVLDEQFYAWEDGRRMAFFIVRSSLPISAMAEDYLIEPAGDGCVLTWRFRVDTFFLLRPVINSRLLSSARSGFKKLEELIESDPDRFSAK